MDSTSQTDNRLLLSLHPLNCITVEFKGLKNQDITIRKLEAKITELEENKEEEIQKELK